MSDNDTNKISFFTGLKQEFAKITWPDKDKIVKQTTAVVITSVVVGVLIAIIDMVVQYGVNLLSL